MLKRKRPTHYTITQRKLALFAVLALLLVTTSVVFALDFDALTATWSNPVGSSGAPTCYNTSGGTVLFGDDDADHANCPPADPSVQSGFGFTSGGPANFASGEVFSLGQLTHYNNQVFADSLLEQIQLNLNVTFSDPAHIGDFTAPVVLQETPNLASPCPFGGGQPCSDRIEVGLSNYNFTSGGVDYQFSVVGVGPAAGGSCVYNEATVSNAFISAENSANSACLYGRLTALSGVYVDMDKEATPPTASPGDVVDYRINYTCASQTPGVHCENFHILDQLPAGVEYIGSTGSSHTVSANGTYNAAAHTVSFDFNNPLPAGSPGYVTVRVRVRDTGTIGDGELIRNLATGTLTNGPTLTVDHDLPISAPSNWTVTKTGPSTVYFDTERPLTNNTYTVAICSNGSAVNLENAQMVDTLPTGAVYVSSSGGGVYDAVANTVTWDLGTIAHNAGCVNRTVTVQYPDPPFVPGQPYTVVNTVDASGDPVGQPPWTDEDEVSNPLVELVPDPRATIVKGAVRNDYVIGATAQFQLRPANTGNVALQNFVMVDYIPDAIDLTSITVGSYNNYAGQSVGLRYRTNDGTWHTWPGSPFASNVQLNVSSLGLAAGVYITQVEWNYGTVPSGFSANNPPLISGTLITPDRGGNPVVDGQRITNNATLDWDYSGVGDNTDGNATVEVVPIPEPYLDKQSVGGVSQQWRFIIGESGGYYRINAVNNTGIALEDFTITDTIPPQFRVTQITRGQYSNYGAGNVEILFELDESGVWTSLGSFPNVNAPIDLVPHTPAGSFVTGVRWAYGDVPVNFQPSSEANWPSIYGEVLETDRNGAPVDDTQNLVNRAELEWTFGGTTSDIDDSTTDRIRIPTAFPSPYKSTTTNGPYIPTSVVSYSLQVGAAGDSPSPLVDPIVADLLPEGLEYVPGSWGWDAGTSGAPAPTFEEIPDYGGSGRTLIRWRFDHDFARGTNGRITFDATLVPGVAIGNLSNRFIITTNEIEMQGTGTDTDDLDGDGETDDPVVSSTTTVYVDELIGLDSVKSVRGALDSAFSADGLTTPNGAIDYAISIINSGNIPVDNVSVIDILPYVGDTGVQDIRPRNSEWRPYLTTPVSAPAGVTVYYSTHANPCRPAIVPSGPAGCTGPGWTAAPPADITQVQSLRFDFAGVLNPGERFNFSWRMQAPPDPTGALEGTYAWNSFAFTSRNAVTQVPLRPAEPNAVRIRLETPLINPLIQLVKYTNGEDANTPTGPLIEIGDPVTWTYVITNIGNTRLANITLTDDIEGVIQDATTAICAEGRIPSLEPDDTFTCTVTGVATAGQYANIGTVTGDPTVPGDPGDTPIEDPTNPGNPMPPVDDDDPSHYYGFDPNLARLGDLVWIDNNANGVQDPGEPGLGGITVNLYDMTDPANPVYLDTTTTDSTGFYNFVDLQPGDYQVEFVLPPMYSFTTQDAGGNDAADSDADPTTGLSHIVTLGAGEYDPTIDAGVISVASIGDFVWYDTNGDGIQDPGEPGAVGITVHLLDENNNIIDTTVTDADGYYGFIDLPPGTYSIRVERPTGYTFSPRDQGANDGVDSDADLNGDMDQTTLLPGQHDPNWDAGLVQVSALGDYVWYDMNNNGIQDAGEAPVPGVTVRLLDAAGNPVVDASGTPVAPQTTAADGSYLFTNLIPGQYIVEFELPPGNVFSPQNQGANDAVDSDADPTTGRTSVITLPPGVTDRTWDAGIVPLASIGDRVWEDQDGDGIQDPGEPGIPNVTVILYDENNNEVDRTTTDPNGNYIFEDLPPGDYSLEFVPPPGYVISPPDQGGNDAVDSDADPTTGRTVVTTLDPGENDMTWDAGLSPLSSLGDYVWRDNNGDGIQDAGEPPVRGVTVILYDGNNVEVARTTTDANGYYIFENLRAGDYVVEFVPPAGYEFSPQGQGGDTALDSNADPITGRTSTIALGWGEHNPTIDAGIVPLGSIGDRVWLDYNEDGHQDPNEPGIPGVVVNLYDGNNVLIDSTRTNGNGEYLFTNLPAGTYTVEVDLTTLPPDLRATFDWDGNLDSVTTVTLGIGEHIRYVDFGYVPPFVPGDGDWKPEPTPTPIVTPTPTPVRIDGTWGTRPLPPVETPEWEALSACEFMCVDWQLYHSNRTGDWEIFRLGDHHSGLSIGENLSQGEGYDDISPSRSPNAEWIVFASNRDGNWELYVAATNGDSSKTQRLTYNEVAMDTNPVWGPNNYVVYETTRNGNWDLYLLDMSTGRSEQLTTHSGSDVNAFWSPDGTKIVFQSDRSGQWQIYELDLRTNIVTLLSDGQGVDVDPQYNNAGTQIAFRSYRDGRENSVIYTANANGEGVQAISDLNGDATNHAWSPDDTLIAYQSEIDNSLDIYVYQLGSRATRQVTDDVDVNNYAPTWKCGSNELLFTSEDTGNPDIFTVNALPITAPAVVIEEEAEQLTFDVADDIYPQGAPVKELASREGQVPNANQALGEQTSFLQPDVSVTDRDISVELGEAFEPLNSCVTVCQSWTLYHSDQPGNWDIFRLDQGSNSPINISRASDATDFSPTRSPNGEWVAFVSDRDGNKEIYVAAADGTNHRRVTYNEANDTIPVWSPNSQYLVYESDRNGNWDLFLFDLSTGKETQLTQGSSDDVNATWSSAGGRIVFQSNRDGRWQLYALTLRDMATTRLTDQAENTIEPSYSVNGSYIAFRVVNSDGKTVLHIMEEDGSDLRAISDPDGSASNHSWYFDDTLLAYQSDLDGDLDIYVYDVANDLTRQVTQNDVPDYAPTWICGEPMVIFTSTVSGSPDIFETNAQPMDAPPISVDSGANQLTFGNDRNEFPVGMPSQENASRSLDD